MIFNSYILYYYNFELYKLFISLVIISAIIILIPFISNLLILKSETKEKISGYECGFEPFETARSKFEVKFFLVSILFIIFDLEVIFLFPYVLILNPVNFIVIFFLIILTIGFVYEYSKGALDWN